MRTKSWLISCFSQEGRAVVAPLLGLETAEVTNTDLTQLSLEVVIPDLPPELIPTEGSYLKLPTEYIADITVKLVGPQQTLNFNIIPEGSSLNVSRSHLGTIIEGSLDGDIIYDDGTTATFLTGVVIVIEEQAGYFSPVISNYQNNIGFGIPFRNLKLTSELLYPLSTTPTVQE
ncbi:MAG: hypothetical protein HC893_05625 [Chloroflexaceae bacterium]|nr:hypothetical protein [Chloroflexaceae bacterium]